MEILDNLAEQVQLTKEEEKQLRKMKKKDLIKTLKEKGTKDYGAISYIQKYCEKKTLFLICQGKLPKPPLEKKKRRKKGGNLKYFLFSHLKFFFSRFGRN